jgi:hypothetical protein
MSTRTRSRKAKIERRAIQIINAMDPPAKCDRGGCKNHEGACSMDVHWDAAIAQAQAEFRPASSDLDFAQELRFA